MTVLQGLQARLPRRCRHGRLQSRVPGPAVRRAAAPGHALLAGLAAAVAAPGPPDPQRRAAELGRPAHAPGRAGQAPRRDHAGTGHSRLAGESFQAWFARRAPRPESPETAGPRLLLWPDTFINYLEPSIGRDAVAALEVLGYRVEVPAQPVCCGLTWISTGQLDHAKRVMTGTRPVTRIGAGS